jgi:Protein of unknown function (DUF3800)
LLPRRWKRRKNVAFVDEVVDIANRSGATFYAVTLSKENMKHPMTLRQTMPLQLQALVEHFEVECRYHGDVGMIVADWSSHHADEHASSCVASFVASRRLNFHPCVYYASSHATEAIQLADLCAAVFRRSAEGDRNMGTVVDRMTKTCSMPSENRPLTSSGRAFDNAVTLF